MTEARVIAKSPNKGFLESILFNLLNLCLFCPLRYLWLIIRICASFAISSFHITAHSGTIINDCFTNGSFLFTCPPAKVFGPFQQGLPFLILCGLCYVKYQPILRAPSDNSLLYLVQLFVFCMQLLCWQLLCK